MRTRQWQGWILGLLFLLSVIILPTITHIKHSQVIAVEPTSAKDTVKQAQQFYSTGNYQQSVEFWQQASHEFAAKNQLSNQAMALSNLSLSYQKLGQWQQAEKAILESLSLLAFDTKSASPSQIRLLAQVLNIRGNFYLETGQAEAALETWYSNPLGRKSS